MVPAQEWVVAARKRGHYSALTLLLCEYLSTLSGEVNLVWSQRFSSTTLKFFFCRYVPPFCLAVNLIVFHRLENPNPLPRRNCVLWASLQTSTILALILVVESIQTMKIHAFYSHHPRTLLALRVFRVATLIMTVYSFASIVHNVEYDGACHVVSIPSQLGWAGCTFLTNQVVSLLLVLSPKIVRDSWRTSSLIASTSRDSVFAFFALAAFSTWIVANGSTHLLLPAILCVLSISGCRLIANTLAQLKDVKTANGPSIAFGLTEFSTVINETSTDSHYEGQTSLP